MLVFTIGLNAGGWLIGTLLSGIIFRPTGLVVCGRWLGAKTKLTILSMHVMEASKRIFGILDFRYYALADGMKAVFKSVGKGPIIATLSESIQGEQPTLFGL